MERHDHASTHALISSFLRGKINPERSDGSDGSEDLTAKEVTVEVTVNRRRSDGRPCYGALMPTEPALVTRCIRRARRMVGARGMAGLKRRAHRAARRLARLVTRDLLDYDGDPPRERQARRLTSWDVT